jgi:hypothetical protein
LKDCVVDGRMMKDSAGKKRKNYGKVEGKKRILQNYVGLRDQVNEISMNV